MLARSGIHPMGRALPRCVAGRWASAASRLNAMGEPPGVPPMSPTVGRLVTLDLSDDGGELSALEAGMLAADLAAAVELAQPAAANAA